ncbi:MAG TPA: GNAT family N-acetyltransferase [Bdellovibrio sp.]|nr:GNAT family N-acetyltransferase [Bdellovibrio sp.]
MTIQIKKLTTENFADYEKLTSCESGGGCYCSFWHQKWASMADWEKCKKETPEVNRNIIFEKVRSGFHVGALAYENNNLLAWISVGPMTDFFWTWRRALSHQDQAKDIAGIVCFTVAPEFRGQGVQRRVLETLKEYSREQKWKSIEAYPFDKSALEKHKSDVIWPGLENGYIEAGFQRLGPHWLSNENAERSIYNFDL